jgi:hypothetical protein
VDDRVVGEGLEPPKGLEQVRGAATREVRPAGAACEQRVPREQMPVHEQRQRVRRVSRGIDDFHRPRAEGQTRAAADPPGRRRELRGGMGQHGGPGLVTEPADAGEVIGMRMGIEDVDQTELATAERVQEQIALVETRVDGERRPAGFVHDQVGEAAV